MISLPIDIINYIFEYSSQKDDIWHPFISHKNSKLCWKVNKDCEEYIEKSRILYHISDKCSIYKTNGEIDLVSDYDNVHIRTRYNAFGFHHEGGNIIYVRFSLVDSNEAQITFSVMLNFIYYSNGGDFILKSDDTHLYLNGDIFGIITYAFYYHDDDENGDSMYFIYKPTSLNDMLLFHSSNLMSK